MTQHYKKQGQSMQSQEVQKIINFSWAYGGVGKMTPEPLARHCSSHLKFISPSLESNRDAVVCKYVSDQESTISNKIEARGS